MAIRAARDCDLSLSVRGGGHDWAGRALCDGVVIDLSGMRSVAVASDETAEVSGGARAADLLAATDPLGLVAATGAAGCVGMAGLTLGGGYGPLIGRFGLALDNLEAAEVVLADGRVVAADADSEEELFWALRGGGGNFGVVTSMRVRLHPVPSVRSGSLIYPLSEARAVLSRCVEIAASAPDELTFQICCIAGRDGTPMVVVVPTWCGRPDEGEAQLAQLRLGTPLADTVETTRYGITLAAFDKFLVNGQRNLMETCWLPALDSGAVDAIVRAAETAILSQAAPSSPTNSEAPRRVPEHATAFGPAPGPCAHRISGSVTEIADEFEEQRHRLWARAARHAFGGIALPGGYPTLACNEDPDRVARSYGRNAERLIQSSGVTILTMSLLGHPFAVAHGVADAS